MFYLLNSLLKPCSFLLRSFIYGCIQEKKKNPGRKDQTRFNPPIQPEQCTSICPPQSFTTEQIF